MIEDYVEQRRRYIKEIRNSFEENPGAENRSVYFRSNDQAADEPDTVGSAVFWKLKIVLSIMLFAAFVLCDRTGMKIFTLSAQTIAGQIEKNTFFSSKNDLTDQVKEILNDFNYDNLISDK